MRPLLASLFLFGAVSTYAQEIRCIDKILPFPRPSAVHQLSKNDWTPSQEKLAPAEARIALESLLFGKLLCRSQEIEIKSEALCKDLIEAVATTSTCIIVTSLGNFTINKDYQNNANFIFIKDKNTIGTK
jgi:hypothetical protein